MKFLLRDIIYGTYIINLYRKHLALKYLIKNISKPHGNVLDWVCICYSIYAYMYVYSFVFDDEINTTNINRRSNVQADAWRPIARIKKYPTKNAF